MSKEKPARKPYPSDLTDEQWAILEPMIPGAHTQHGGHPREVVHTIVYLNRSGRQAPPIAAARQERRLLAVACTRLLGPALASRGLEKRFLTPFLPADNPVVLLFHLLWHFNNVKWGKRLLDRRRPCVSLLRASFSRFLSPPVLA